MSRPPGDGHHLKTGVSVIIPVLNGARSVGRCVESILASREPPDTFEVICVDNGSSDATGSILSNFQPRIKVLHEVKRGPAAARNAGLRAATRGVVAFTDADCTVDSLWLTHLVGALHQGKVGAVGGKILPRPEAGRVEQFGELVHDHQKAIEEDRPPYVITMNLAARTEMLHSIGLFDERFIRMEDVDLAYRIVAAGERIVYQPDAVVYHHNRDTLRTLAREGFLHGYYRPAFLHLHRQFIDDYRKMAETGSIARTIDRPPEPPPAAATLQPWRVGLYWKVFNWSKKAGEMAGRRMSPRLG
jgi:GT2 family glycosyltransferase